MKTADEYAGSAGRVPLGEPSASGEAGPDGSGDQSRPASIFDELEKAITDLAPNPRRASKALDMINQRRILIERARDGEQIGVPDWLQPPTAEELAEVLVAGVALRNVPLTEIDRLSGDLRAIHRRQMQEIRSSMVRGIATCTGSRSEYLMAGHADRLRQRSISWGGVVLVGTMFASALLSGIGAMVTLNFIGQAAGWW